MNVDSTGVDAAVERAAALCDLSRWDDAAQLLRTALSGDPHNYRALCLLSLTQLKLQAYSDSLNTAQAAIAAEPTGEWAYRLASVSMTKLNRHREAVAIARRSVELAPLQSESYRALAQALVGQGGNLDEARWVADRGLALAPNAVDAFVMVGTVAAAAGRVPDAEDAYRRALAIDPNSSVAHNELARLALGQNRIGRPGGLAAAAGGFATAVRADPKGQTSRRNLELVLHVFLARTAYLIFLVAYIGGRLSQADTPPAVRAIPALLLLIPLGYAIRFLSQLTPPLRRLVRDFLRRPAIAIAVGCDSLAVVALIAGAAVASLDTAAFLGAVGLAFIARVSLWWTRRKQLPRKSRR